MKKRKINEMSNLTYYQLIEKANRQFKVYKMSWTNFEDKNVYELGGPGVYKLQAMIYGGNGPVFAVDYNDEYYVTFLPAYNPAKFKDSSMLFEFIDKTEAEGTPVSKYVSASWEKYSGYNFTMEYLQSKGNADAIISGAQGYGIELNESKNKVKNMKPIMEFTAKEFKKMLNKEKPVVVEQITVGQFKKKIKESREVMRLGLGFEDPNATPKKSKDKPYERIVGKKGGVGLGLGFKLEEKLKNAKFMTESQIVDLIEEVVNSLKGKTEYHGLKFVDRIGQKYGVNEGNIKKMKSIIKEGKNPKTASRSLYKFVAGLKGKVYEGFKNDGGVMVPMIKKYFNDSKTAGKTNAEAIKETANKLKLPESLIFEMMNIQRTAKQKGKSPQLQLESCYGKHQNESHGEDMVEMYDEIAEMMDFPMAEDFGDPSMTKFQKYGTKPDAMPAMGKPAFRREEDPSFDFDIEGSPEMDMPEPDDYTYSDDYNPEYDDMESDYDFGSEWDLNKDKNYGFLESDCEDCEDDEMLNELDTEDDYSYYEKNPSSEYRKFQKMDSQDWLDRYWDTPESGYDMEDEFGGGIEDDENFEIY